MQLHLDICTVTETMIRIINDIFSIKYQLVILGKLVHNDKLFARNHLSDDFHPLIFICWFIISSMKDVRLDITSDLGSICNNKECACKNQDYLDYQLVYVEHVTSSAWLSCFSFRLYQEDFKMRFHGCRCYWRDDT